jgi:putative redox protein
MRSEGFTFPGAHGADLAARLDLPEGPVLGSALFAHCFTCGKDLIAARRIAGRLAAQGLAVLRFDFTGIGHSGGEFANTTFQGNADDLVAASAAMAARGLAPGLLIGHSLGGAAVIAARARIASTRAVVLIGAPFSPGHVVEGLGPTLPASTRDGTTEISLAGRRITLGAAFLADVRAARIDGALADLRAALLVLHAPRDRIVGIDNAGRIFAAAKHPKSYVSLDDADHLLSDPDDAEYAAGVIAAWAARYLALRPPAPPPGIPEGITRVSEADPSGFLQDIRSGPHHLLADEPLAYGGSNRGPSPYGLLAAGLGACTAMTIRMYARKKGLALDHVSVDVSHAKVHAQDAGEAATDRIDSFRRVIRLTGDLTPVERDRLMQIADRCPVHRTLAAGATIVTEAAE